MLHSSIKSAKGKIGLFFLTAVVAIIIGLNLSDVVEGNLPVINPGFGWVSSSRDESETLSRVCPAAYTPARGFPFLTKRHGCLTSSENYLGYIGNGLFAGLVFLLAVQVSVVTIKKRQGMLKPKK